MLTNGCPDRISKAPMPFILRVSKPSFLVVAMAFSAMSPAPAGDDSASAASELPAASEKTIDFATDVEPILERSCTKCHADGKRKRGFSVDHIHSFLAGGETGPAVVSGKSAESLLIELVVSSDPDERMPSGGDPLSSGEVAVLRAWIDQGLPWEKGYVHGETADERPCTIVKDPVNTAQLHASIYRALGIPHDHHYNVEQRPFYVTPDGTAEPVMEFFG
jgi:hypothetical protein